jgi:hypothetical protein
MRRVAVAAATLIAASTAQAHDYMTIDCKFDNGSKGSYTVKDMSTVTNNHATDLGEFTAQYTRGWFDFLGMPSGVLEVEPKWASVVQKFYFKPNGYVRLLGYETDGSSDPGLNADCTITKTW